MVLSRTPVTCTTEPLALVAMSVTLVTAQALVLSAASEIKRDFTAHRPIE